MNMRLVNLFHGLLPYVRLVQRQIRFNVRTQIETHKECYYSRPAFKYRIRK
jgi:hypothetical protein